MCYVVVNLSHCSYYYQPKSADDFMMISLRQLITDKHLHWGFPKCFVESGNWDISGIINDWVYCQLKLNIL